MADRNRAKRRQAERDSTRRGRVDLSPSQIAEIRGRMRAIERQAEIEALLALGTKAKPDVP